MKVQFEKDKVKTGIQKAISIMPSKTGAAVLRSLWIKAENDTITFFSTDANIEFSGSYPAHVKEPGFIGVQGQIFYGLLSTCEGNIDLSIKEGDGSVRLKHSAGVCKLPVMSPNWFEEMKPYPNNPSVYWAGDMIKEIIDKIFFSINDDFTTLDALSCLYITKNGPKIDICGLNGHLFAMYSIVHDQIYQSISDDGVLIQKTYLPQIKKWLTNDDIELNFTETSVFFKNSNNEHLTVPRAVNLQFPDYMNFLNRLTKGFSTLRLNKKDFIRTLNRILTVDTSPDSSTELNISENNNVIECHANNESTGEVSEQISIQYDGSIRKISFRTKDLLSVIEHFESDEIEMKLTSELGPCGFYGDEDPFYQVVLMPLQTLEKSHIEEN